MECMNGHELVRRNSHRLITRLSGPAKPAQNHNGIANLMPS